MFHTKQFILAVVTSTILSSVFAAAYMASFTLQPARAQNESAATSGATTKHHHPQQTIEYMTIPR
jgi:NhaP-type Na+/H+ or K+/H+ antiporter